jgi:L-glyceraldehyde 3-phosphate reductase
MRPVEIGADVRYALAAPPLTQDELAATDRHAVDSGVNLWANPTQD